MSIDHVKVTEKELVYLIEHAPYVDLAFGPGWAALKYDPNKPMQPALKLLGLMRGVLNENLEGAGI